MSAQVMRNPTDPGLLTAHSSSSQLKNGHDKHGYDKERNEGATPLGESPDLLRWRADMLMDEMMLGAIDVYAGESKATPGVTVAPVYPAPTGHQAFDEPTSAPNGQPVNGQRSLPSARLVQENGKNGTHHKAELPSEKGVQNHQGATNSLPNKGYRGNGHDDKSASRIAPSPQRQEPAAYEHQVYDNRQVENRQVNQTTQGNAASSQTAVAPAASSQSQAREPKAWVFSAEARYQQIARDQQNTQPDELASANFTSAIPAPTAPRWMPDEPTTLPTNRSENHVGINGNSVHGPELGPVRRTVAQATNAMATPATSGPMYGGSNSGAANRNSKWSNLLPRMSNTDVETLQQEITTLHSEINALLPAGHESNKRAQHLLEKARTILESDPTRSAEVEYYLQQVRTIFQRIQQTIHWSNLYRQRLMIYLAAWSLLAVILLLASYIYPAQINGLLADLGQWPLDSFVVQNFAAWLSTLAAGALGGAIGALFNLRLRSRLEHGFFDRKYSLRSLILPIMGMLFGLLLYVIIGPCFYFLALDPSTNLAASTLPVLIAFAFGIGQEFIYGTRS